MTPKEYLAKVHEVPCVLCEKLGLMQESETYAHHLRQGVGKAQKAPDVLTAALCWDCHQGQGGIHGDRGRWRMARWSEYDAIAATIKAVISDV